MRWSILSTLRVWMALVGIAFAVAATAQAPDVVRGAVLYQQRCGGCHSIDANRVGPRHRGVIGRKAGSIADYNYSPALHAANFAWDEARLNVWLQGPSRLVPGTKMFFSVPDPKERAAIIAYLRTQGVSGK